MLELRNKLQSAASTWRPLYCFGPSPPPAPDYRYCVITYAVLEGIGCIGPDMAMSKSEQPNSLVLRSPDIEMTSQVSSPGRTFAARKGLVRVLEVDEKFYSACIQ